MQGRGVVCCYKYGSMVHRAREEAVSHVRSSPAVGLPRVRWGPFLFLFLIFLRHFYVATFGAQFNLHVVIPP